MNITLSPNSMKNAKFAAANSTEAGTKAPTVQQFVQEMIENVFNGKSAVIYLNPTPTPEKLNAIRAATESILKADTDQLKKELEEKKG